MSRLIDRTAVVAAAAASLLSGCGAGTGANPAVERGRLMMAQYQCGSCHTIPGVRASRGQVGPSLASFGQRSYIAGRMANRPEVLARWIESPQALVPGTAMPDMGASPDDARAMAAYLSSLR